MMATMTIDTVINLAISMYVGEPCRICGAKITIEDIKDGAVFVGYNEDNTSRSAHRRCWYGFVKLVQSQSVLDIDSLRAIDADVVWGEKGRPWGVGVIDNEH